MSHKTWRKSACYHGTCIGAGFLLQKLCSVRIAHMSATQLAVMTVLMVVGMSFVATEIENECVFSPDTIYQLPRTTVLEFATSFGPC